MMTAQLSMEEGLEGETPDQVPQLYLCDDWIQPVRVARKPRVMTTKETMKANVAKNCLIFLDEAELRSRQEIPCSQKTKEVTNEGSAECKEEDPAVGGHSQTEAHKEEDSAVDGHSQTEAEKEVIRACRTLLYGCEEQWSYATQQDSVSSESEAEGVQCQQTPHVMTAQLSMEEGLEGETPDQVPQLYLCDDWIQPVRVARKPRVMTTKETMKANVAKNCLILTMMSLELGFGPVIERYQQARDAVVERYQHGRPEDLAYLASEMLTDDEMLARAAEQPDEAVSPLVAPASMPPPTCLVKGKKAGALSQVHAVTPKDTSLKLYHVMSVKLTLREDLAECAYQFSCRAAIGLDPTCMLSLCSLNPWNCM